MPTTGLPHCVAGSNVVALAAASAASSSPYPRPLRTRALMHVPRLVDRHLDAHDALDLRLARLHRVLRRDRHLALGPTTGSCTRRLPGSGASSCCTLCVVAAGPAPGPSPSLAARGDRARGRRARARRRCRARRPGRRSRRCPPASAAAPRPSPPGATLACCLLRLRRGLRLGLVLGFGGGGGGGGGGFGGSFFFFASTSVMAVGLRRRAAWASATVPTRQRGVEQQAPAVDVERDRCAELAYSLATLMANLVMPCCLARSMTCTTRPCSACASALTTRLGSPGAAARLAKRADELRVARRPARC